MPRKQAIKEAIYLDEAEGFILEHALISPPRTWPPLPPEPQEKRLVANRKKMNWEQEVLQNPDEPIDNIPIRVRKKSSSSNVKYNYDHHNEGEGEGEGDEEDEDEVNKERCVICLMALRDRTVVGVCGHEFCFECIGVWANQSRRCPLCSADMAPFLLHDLDANIPTKFYLPPLPTRKHIPTSVSSIPGPSRTRLPEIVRRERVGEREDVEPDELDLQVERRREVYRYGLYVKHIGSNPNTKFRPSPTPKQLSEDPNLIQRATIFLRRELRVWSPLIDIEFMTTYIISLLKTIDIRSEPAVRLLADYLDLNGNFHHDEANITSCSNAEHLSHELYNYLRSPFKELRKWDEVIQYDPIPSPESLRSHSPAPSRGSRSRSRSISNSRSLSPSPGPHPHSRSRSRSPSRPPPKRGRQWSRRDIFVPSTSPDAKRWNESDSWLDPEYAQWLEDERQREEDRRERKRIRRLGESERRNNLQLHDRIGDHAQLPLQSRNDVKPKRVELLPEPPEPPLRMDEVLEDSKELDTTPKVELHSGASQRIPSGLSIKGAARTLPVSTSGPVDGIDESVPTEPKSRRILLDKLAKEKTARLSISNSSSIEEVAHTNSTGVSSKLTTEEVKVRLARLKAENAGLPPSSDTATATNGTVNKKQLMKERLARLKAQSALNGPSETQPMNHEPITSPTITSPPVPSPPITQPSSKAGLRESIRRRISLKTKLQAERNISFVKKENESKAQELRRRLLENKARKEREQIESNFGGFGEELGLNFTGLISHHEYYAEGDDDNAEQYSGGNENENGNDEENEGISSMDAKLIRMDYEERKKEIRRRLMRLKILNAETDSERRTRELKERLLAQKRQKQQQQLL